MKYLGMLLAIMVSLVVLSLIAISTPPDADPDDPANNLFIKELKGLSPAEQKEFWLKKQLKGEITAKDLEDLGKIKQIEDNIFDTIPEEVLKELGPEKWKAYLAGRLDRSELIGATPKERDLVELFIEGRVPSALIGDGTRIRIEGNLFHIDGLQELQTPKWDPKTLFDRKQIEIHPFGSDLVITNNQERFIITPEGSISYGQTDQFQIQEWENPKGPLLMTPESVGRKFNNYGEYVDYVCGGDKSCANLLEPQNTYKLCKMWPSCD